MATALVLMSLNKGNNAMRIQEYLFGSIVTISWDQIKILGFYSFY